tara:strand:- start:405 stop:752 length:348 start_codon:yes stop_codon:yes gene_type:complete
MFDMELEKRIKGLRKFLKKVKPTYYYVRGWEDFRTHLIGTLDELERRSKYMDYLQTKYAEDKLRGTVLRNALAPRRRDANGKLIQDKFTDEEYELLIEMVVEHYRENPVSPSWRA